VYKCSAPAIFRWYGTLRDIEERALAATSPAERADILTQLDGVEKDVRTFTYLSATRKTLHLRMHIQFIRKILLDAAQPLLRETGHLCPAR